METILAWLSCRPFFYQSMASLLNLFQPGRSRRPFSLAYWATITCESFPIMWGLKCFTAIFPGHHHIPGTPFIARIIGLQVTLMCNEIVNQKKFSLHHFLFETVNKICVCITFFCMFIVHTNQKLDHFRLIKQILSCSMILWTILA